jgi:hypothetical protein
MGSQNGGGGGQSDNALITVVLTVGTAKKIITAFSANPPQAPDRATANLVVNRLNQALGPGGGGKGGGGKGGGGGGGGGKSARGATLRSASAVSRKTGPGAGKGAGGKTAGGKGGGKPSVPPTGGKTSTTRKKH